MRRRQNAIFFPTENVVHSGTVAFVPQISGIPRSSLVVAVQSVQTYMQEKKMKKEAVSVLRPRVGKVTKNKVKKVVAKKTVQQENKTIEKRGDGGSGGQPPRGTKLKILSIQNLDIGDNLKCLKSQKSQAAGRKKTNPTPKDNTNGDAKKRKHVTIVKSKMAATGVEKNDENAETRGRPKKKSKFDVEKPVLVSPKKESQSKIKPPSTITNVKTKSVNKKKTKKRKPASAEKTLMETSGDLKLNKQHILSSIKAIKKLARKQLDSKKSLLPDENHPIHLQVVCVKVPKTPRRHIRTYLPHPLATPMDDVAIFVPDLELGRKRDYEKTVEHWETKFQEQGVDFIKQILPMNQVKTEYSQFEMKRKLAASFDFFLADGKIVGHLTHLLGKCFYKRRSPPTPVKLDRDNLKRELKNALRKTCMEVHPFGDSHSVQAGTVSMKSTELAENIWAICQSLVKEYPGGWPNIRAIRIKSHRSPAIPIYLTLKSKNAVPVPHVKPKRPNAYQTVEGELSTLPGNTTVQVTPEGKIKVIKTKDTPDEEKLEEIKEETDEDEESDESQEEGGKKIKVKDEDDEDEDEDDEEDADEDDDHDE